MTALGILPGSDGSGAQGVSGNGEVVVGYSGSEAVRWTNAGIEGLGFLAGGTFSSAYDASGDGSVIVGVAEDVAVPNEMAFRWESGVMTSLTHYPEGTFYSTANAVSADGAFVVGRMVSWSSGNFNSEAFRWSEGEMLALGHLSSDPELAHSEAFDVSADGAVVVGVSYSADGNDAFVWTEAAGMRRLIDVLAARGATGIEGWVLQEISAVSADGRWVVGWGDGGNGFSEAFLADISGVPEPHAFWLVGSALTALASARRRSS